MISVIFYAIYIFCLCNRKDFFLLMIKVFFQQEIYKYNLYSYKYNLYL